MSLTIEELKRYHELREKWPRTAEEERLLLRLHTEANAYYGTYKKNYDKPIPFKDAELIIN